MPHPLRRCRAMCRRASAMFGLSVGVLLASSGCIAATTVTAESTVTADEPVPTRAARLERDVTALATDIGERHIRVADALAKAEAWVHARLIDTGLTTVRESFVAGEADVANVYIDVKGTERPDEWIIVGAHYDSAIGTPGANDNATGTAAMIDLAHAFSKSPARRSIRFVAFVNEEPPYFQTGAMGSLIHADRCKARNEQIAGMISIETIGCFSDVPGSQRFPAGLAQRFPTTGNFIAFVTEPKSAPFSKRFFDAYAAGAAVPAEFASLPPTIPGVAWSDHWSFWQHGYEAMMVTDTAPFRYPHYHKKTDTPDKLDFARMAQVVDGLERAIRVVADAAPANASTHPADAAPKPAAP